MRATALRGAKGKTVWKMAAVAVAGILWLTGCAHDRGNLNPSSATSHNGQHASSNNPQSADQLLARVEAVEAGVKRLDSEVARLQENMTKLLAQAPNNSELEAQVQQIQAQISELPDKIHAQLLNDVSKQVKSLTQPSGSRTNTLRSTYEVVQGDTLQSVAARPDVYGDKEQWQKLYEANRDLIARPNDLSPGMILIIPREAEREQK